MTVWALAVEGLENLADLEAIKPQIRLAATRAVNKTARDGRVGIARDIRRQVAFPAAYLAPQGGRLFVSKVATETNLEAKITARGRPTSLARFVRGAPKRGETVTVEVEPGKARFMRRAFLIKLRAGSASIDTKSNLGLAIRLRPGERLENKKTARAISKGLYVLYGPSVQQLFEANSGRGAAKDSLPALAAQLEREFLTLSGL